MVVLGPRIFKVSILIIHEKTVSPQEDIYTILWFPTEIISLEKYFFHKASANKILRKDFIKNIIDKKKNVINA